MVLAAKLLSTMSCNPSGFPFQEAASCEPRAFMPERPLAISGNTGRPSEPMSWPSCAHTSTLTNMWVGNQLRPLEMSEAASYTDLSKSVTVPSHTPDADAAVSRLSAARLSLAIMASPIRSFKIKPIAAGEVKSMSCTDNVTCPASVVFVTELEAITIVVAETGASSEPCAATLVWVVMVGRIKVFCVPPSG